jgi:hypothetical protein
VVVYRAGMLAALQPRPLPGTREFVKAIFPDWRKELSVLHWKRIQKSLVSVLSGPKRNSVFSDEVRFKVFIVRRRSKFG